MEKNKYEGWLEAPIDNKNIMTDFADDVRLACDDCGDRETFWKEGALFVIDYTFGSHIAYIRNVYGKKSEKIAYNIKKELDEMEEAGDSSRLTVCDITVEGCDVKLAFYFKPDELLDNDEQTREEKVLEALEKLDEGIDFDDTSVKVPLLDEYKEKYGERYVTLNHAFAYYGEIRVEGDHYDICEDFNLAELSTVSQNEIYKAIFNALEQENDETRD